MRALTLFLTLTLLGPSLHAEVQRERYALVVGSNAGGQGTAPLKYASSDAKRFQDVLTKLGGLKEENSLLLVNPGRENLLQGLEFLQSKIRKASTSDRQAQFIFYYSGHSDERGLLLGGERLGWDELKVHMDRPGPEVRIVVLDSCSSGAFTRNKGGKITAPFLLDLSSDVEGHAFLTSSTAEEVSQESDRIASSFFTHALIEGLRGAADANSDGQVTLNEAYEYAYGQTTADTQATTGGTQHPAFEIQLSGQGNLVMTDLRSGGPTLVFAGSVSGKVTVRDISNRLVAEVFKSADQDLVLGLEEGYYRIGWENAGTLAETTVVVDEPRPFPQDPSTYTPVSRSKAQKRGQEGNTLEYAPVGLVVTNPDDVQLWSLNLIGGQVARLDGTMEALIFNRIIEDGTGFQGALFANVVGGNFSGVQGSFGVNLVDGDAVGFQNAWLLNHVSGRFSGVQLGGFNHIQGTMNFAQIGGVNLLEDEGRYLQLGFWNQAVGFTGVQAGLLFNRAQSINGVQIGLVNYSDEQVGVQIGLINISQKLTGLPIGLIDIQFNGQNHLDQTLGFTGSSWDTLDQDLTSTTTFRFGSEYFYKYFSLGTRLAYRGENDILPALALGAGIGFRLPVLLPGFALHLDAGTAYTRETNVLDLRRDSDPSVHFVPQFKTFASYAIWQNYGVVAGWEHPIYTQNFHPSISPKGKVEIKTDWGNLLMANRFFIGVQL